MKLKNVVQYLDPKKKPKHYSYEVMEYNIDDIGIVRYAQWKHPSESIKPMSAELVNKYREYIKEGDFCIDIGAHSGDTTLPMALAAGKSGCVLALEPNPFVYPVLEKVARANADLVNIKTIMAAAGKEKGFMEFEYSDAGFCNGGRHENISSLQHGHMYKQTVFAINLEEELRSDFSAVLPNFSFLKVDAEGYDLYILKSLVSVISDYRPAIKVEVYKKTDTKYRQEMVGFFAKHNYTAYIVKAEPIEKGEHLTENNLDERKHYDILALPNED